MIVPIRRSARFQQDSQVTYDSMNRERMKQYQSAKNIDLVSPPGQAIQVMGPVVFSGDLPTRQALFAWIRSCQMVGGAFPNNLMNLSAGAKYVIERSVVVVQGQLTAVDSFAATQPNHVLSDIEPPGRRQGLLSNSLGAVKRSRMTEKAWN